MKSEIYQVENNDNPIFITVTVSTAGIAETEVTKYLTDGSYIIIANSPNATGIIPRTLLGTAKDLVGKSIEIDTDIYLDHIPKDDWPACYKNLQIKYYLEGGKKEQQQPFLCLPADKHKSASGKTIGAEKFIDITL
ncbi:hypothetical protein [Flavobacterium soyae]|uniref:hypothetical protein n=1 Tax=Flavobacterium soyae TaxID=2903098 RepID=UPI001E575EBB|nr:hypothetical protein [Flavobacterium soyae]MCD9575991.1 hypothetical protein [Flavobacterium soyae]